MTKWHYQCPVQSNICVAPAGSIPPPGTIIFKPVELKISGMGSENVGSMLVGVIVREATPTPTLHS